MYALILVLILFLVLINIKVVKEESPFFNASVNTLLIVAVYACYTTSFNSVFILFLILFFLKFYNLFQISYDFTGLKRTLIYGGVVVPSIYLYHLPYLLSKKIPFVDDIFYKKLVMAIGTTGVESTFSYSSILFEQPGIKPSYYHWFEFWLANLIHKISQADAYTSLFVISISIVIILSCLGIHEVFEKLFQAKNKFIYPLTLLAILIIFISTGIFKLLYLFSASEIFNKTGNLSINIAIKQSFVIPICISIFLASSNHKKYFIYPLLFSFFYLTIYPATISATLIIGIFILLKEKRGQFEYILIPALGILLFIGFYYLNGESRLTEIQNNPSSQLPHFNHFISWFTKAYILTPVSWIIPLLFLIFKFSRLKKFILAFLSIYITSSFLWFVLYLKLDSNQLFVLFANTMFSFILSVLIIHLILKRKLLRGTILIAISVLPFQSYRGVATNDENIVRLEFFEPYLNEKSIYLNKPVEVSSIYRYNENAYTLTPELFMKSDSVQIAHITSAYPIKEKFNNEERDVIDKHRQRSLYFTECGELDFNDYSCLREFMEKYKFIYLFSEFKVNSSFFNLVDSDRQLFVYELNKEIY